MEFDYDKAKAAAERGEKIYQCRDPEWEAEVLAWDMGNEKYPLAVRRRKYGESAWGLVFYSKNGLYRNDERPYDLVMKPTTKTMYVRAWKKGGEYRVSGAFPSRDHILLTLDNSNQEWEWVSDIVAIDVKE